jgi:ABC-type multidrug transport system permease subunit
VEESKVKYHALGDLNHNVRPYATGFFKQFVELTKRHFKNTVRTPLASVVSLVQALTLAFVIGSIFYQLGFVAPASIQGRVGVLFFIIINGAFGLAQTTGAFIEERLLINRERASGTYAAFPYFMARVVVDTPKDLLQIVLFCVIMYWMAELNPRADRFFIFIAVCLCNALVAGSLYALIGSLAPNVTVGNILVPTVTVFFFLFAGFFISAAAIPPWWIWMYWWSFFRYSYPALMINEFLGETFTCGLTNSTACLRTGEQVLLTYGITPDPNIVWQWILAMLGWWLLYRVLAYLVIEFLQKERR